MRPEQLMAARLRGELYKFVVRWRVGKRRFERVCWVPGGEVWCLTVPRGVKKYRVNCGGSTMGYSRDKWGFYSYDMSKARWHPEPFPVIDDTRLQVNIAVKAKHTSYRRVA